MSDHGDDGRTEPVREDPSDIAARYWEERGGKPEPRPRHPLTPAEEDAYLVRGSELFNTGEFYDGHDEWEEVWRRAEGERRELLHGLIQVAVGYEHLRRDNPHGVQSLLTQGAEKLARHVDRDGVPEIREKALADARRAEEHGLDAIEPPRIMVTLAGSDATIPAGAVHVEVPRG